MSDSEFLKPTELYDLTGFARAAEQEAWLKERNVPHKRDGKRCIVSRFHAREWILGRDIVMPSEPNLEVLRA